MEKQYSFIRDELVHAFAIWDQQAKDGQWPHVSNPEASADHLILLIGEIQAGAH